MIPCVRFVGTKWGSISENVEAVADVDKAREAERLAMCLLVGAWRRDEFSPAIAAAKSSPDCLENRSRRFLTLQDALGHPREVGGGGK